MCGIAGWFGQSIACDTSALIAALRHRGPDGEGVWCDPKGRAVMVHTRLAILDLTESGAQPMGLGAGTREGLSVRSEARDGQSMEHGAGSGELGARSQRSEVGDQGLEIRDQRSEIRGQRSGHWTQLTQETQRTHNGRYWIVFNGEIYNYRSLREELDNRREGTTTKSGEHGAGSREPELGRKALGVRGKAQECAVSGVGCSVSASIAGRPSPVASSDVTERSSSLASQPSSATAEWRSNSDTEVLLRLLARDGKAALPKLAGMFAFAFYDSESGRTLLARDAFGIKPLYYIEHNGTLAFASEMRALRTLVTENKISPDAVRDTLLWGSVPEPATSIGGIRQLPAGCYLDWDGANATVGRWHELRFNGAPPPADPVKVTRAALLESIQRHLVSDVPVGIFLSGGIDSTAVLSLAREVLGPGADVRTFSIGFDDPAYDESAIARRTAQHFGARHTEWRMTAQEGRDEIAGYLSAMDQPSIDGFNTWCASKLARQQGLKVVLSGLGGDEIFAGYGSFRQVPLFCRLHRRLTVLRPLIATLLRQTPAGSRWRRLAPFLCGSGTALAAFHVQRGIFTEAEARQLARSLTGSDPGPVDWSSDGLPDDPRDAVSYLELTRYMRNQLLRDTDVFSMAHGLELRVPFVDARLFQTLAAIPASIRLRRGKQLLLEAVPEIPSWVRNQPKRGFRFPFEEWMKGEFGNLLASADKQTTVPLVTWYRCWALAAVMLKLPTQPGYAPRASTAYCENLLSCH